MERTNDKMSERGCFCISLDFEMFWGMHDAVKLSDYGSFVLKGRDRIADQLALFREYGIHATWAAVGFLLARNCEDLRQFVPSVKPSYLLERRSPYHLIDNMTDEEENYFFAFVQLKKVLNEPNQELGTHTFSHYYCNEEGQSIDEFKADLLANVIIAKERAYPPKSLVFPRNQSLSEYLSAAKEAGIKCYRAEEDNWIYRHIHKSFWLRALRTLDSFLPLSGSNVHPLTEKCGLVNVAGSAFLRPYQKRLALFQGLKLLRIKGQMRAAAKKKQVYHLYWHPHNLGGDGKECLSQQRKIFEYYQKLNLKYGFESRNMGELVELYGR